MIFQDSMLFSRNAKHWISVLNIPQHGLDNITFGDQLFIISSRNGYISTASDSFSLITDLSFSDLYDAEYTVDEIYNVEFSANDFKTYDVSASNLVTLNPIDISGAYIQTEIVEAGYNVG